MRIGLFLCLRTKPSDDFELCDVKALQRENSSAAVAMPSSAKQRCLLRSHTEADVHLLCSILAIIKKHGGVLSPRLTASTVIVIAVHCASIVNPPRKNEKGLVVHRVNVRGSNSPATFAGRAPPRWCTSGQRTAGYLEGWWRRGVPSGLFLEHSPCPMQQRTVHTKSTFTERKSVLLRQGVPS